MKKFTAALIALLITSICFTVSVAADHPIDLLPDIYVPYWQNNFIIAFSPGYHNDIYLENAGVYKNAKTPVLLYSFQQPMNRYFNYRFNETGDVLIGFPYDAPLDLKLPMLQIFNNGVLTYEYRFNEFFISHFEMVRSVSHWWWCDGSIDFEDDIITLMTVNGRFITINTADGSVKATRSYLERIIIGIIIAVITSFAAVLFIYLRRKDFFERIKIPLFHGGAVIVKSLLITIIPVNLFLYIKTYSYYYEKSGDKTLSKYKSWYWILGGDITALILSSFHASLMSALYFHFHYNSHSRYHSHIMYTMIFCLLILLTVLLRVVYKHRKYVQNNKIDDDYFSPANASGIKKAAFTALGLLAVIIVKTAEFRLAQYIIDYLSFERENFDRGWVLALHIEILAIYLSILGGIALVGIITLIYKKMKIEYYKPFFLICSLLTGMLAYFVQMFFL